jgi:glycosyltransferase involved in cell wall biosynthesis
MKILMVIAYFSPEIGSAAHVYHDLGKAFIQCGHEVDLITSYPRDFNLIPSDKGRQFPLEEIIDGIHVHRCMHPALRDSIIFRGMEHFFLTHYYFKSYRTLRKKFDVCLMYIPPLPLYYLSKKIKRFDGTPSILNFQDFHPQELTDVGVLKNPIIIKILEYIEHQAYRNADFITVLSSAGIDYITERGGRPENIAHIYNGVILSDIDTLFNIHDFKERQGIKDKFLVSYAGILSPFQGLDRILDAAKGLTEHKDIIFYIVGDGMIKTHLETRIQNENIENIRLLPLQKRDEYFNIVNSSDVCLICLDERMKAPCFPGKTINLLAAGKPIIAITDRTSETARIITEAACGEVIEPNDTTGLQNAIVRFYASPQQGIIYGEQGRHFLEKNMSLKKSVQFYEKILAKITSDVSREVQNEKK